MFLFQLPSTFRLQGFKSQQSGDPSGAPLNSSLWVKHPLCYELYWAVGSHDRPRGVMPERCSRTHGLKPSRARPNRGKQSTNNPSHGPSTIEPQGRDDYPPINIMILQYFDHNRIDYNPRTTWISDECNRNVNT